MEHLIIFIVVFLLFSMLLFYICSCMVQSKVDASISKIKKAHTEKENNLTNTLVQMQDLMARIKKEKEKSRNQIILQTNELTKELKENFIETKEAFINTKNEEFTSQIKSITKGWDKFTQDIINEKRKTVNKHVDEITAFTNQINFLPNGQLVFSERALISSINEEGEIKRTSFKDFFKLSEEMREAVRELELGL